MKDLIQEFKKYKDINLGMAICKIIEIDRENIIVYVLDIFPDTLFIIYLSHPDITGFSYNLYSFVFFNLVKFNSLPTQFCKKIYPFKIKFNHGCLKL